MPSLPTLLYRADQVRSLERDAIDKQGIPGYVLMSNAGHAVFNLITTRWPDIKRLAVFCGAGNNAGDGYVIARLAHENGLQITVLHLSSPNDLSGDAWQAYAGCVAEGVNIEAYTSQTLAEYDLIVDALLGIGLQRQVSGQWAQAIETINQSGKPVVAVDMPSGIHADTGKVMGIAVNAACTVTFIGLKRGLFTGDAPDYVGEVIFDGLQVTFADAAMQVEDTCRLIDKTVVHTLPRRRRVTHKGQHGRVLVIGGNQGMAGAPIMAGMAALRCGAGLVTIAMRHQHPMIQPELMVHHIESADLLRPLVDAASVLVLGPGLGRDDWALSMLNVACESNKPMLVDADALNLLAQEPSYNSAWVLTPHPGEAARLLNETVDEVQADRFETVKRLAKFYGGVVVLKGTGSLICGKDLSLCQEGNSGMATAGMGDILSGVIAAFMAQGLSSEDAANMGVWVHGRAANLEAEALGARGMLATDLLPRIRQLLND